MTYKLNPRGSLPDAWVWVLILSMLLAGINALQGYAHLSSVDSAVLLFVGFVLTLILKVVEKEE
jgi:hypothetical protein